MPAACRVALVESDKAMLFAVTIEIDFGGETALRAGHEWLLCAAKFAI